MSEVKRKDFPETLVCGEFILDKISMTQLEERFEVRNKDKDYLSEFDNSLRSDYSLETEQKYIKRCLAEWEDRTRFEYSIFDKEDCLIGGVTVSARSTSFCNGEQSFKHVLAYWMKQECESKGIITNVVKTITDFLFEEPCIADKVTIKTVTDNIKSAKVALNNGFLFEYKDYSNCVHAGNLIDAFVFSILKDKKKQKELESIQNKLKSVYGIKF
ncbi:MAG: GNAT family N-acetyltransferase [Proteobacteria bacterium]|nr:GNAT family N-acetyltransferase [Pseudomonadota bacterium]